MKTRPGRGTKGAFNALLADKDRNFQGRAYRVKSFIVIPEVMLLTAEGKEDELIRPVQLALREAQLGDTLPVFMEKLGLRMEVGEGGK